MGANTHSHLQRRHINSVYCNTHTHQHTLSHQHAAMGHRPYLIWWLREKKNTDFRNSNLKHNQPCRHTHTTHTHTCSWAPPPSKKHPTSRQDRRQSQAAGQNNTFTTANLGCHHSVCLSSQKRTCVSAHVSHTLTTKAPPDLNISRHECFRARGSARGRGGVKGGATSEITNTLFKSRLAVSIRRYQTHPISGWLIV